MAKMFTKNSDGEFEEITAFTQDEVDSIIEKRIQRERAKYSDYDSLHTQVSELQEQLKAADAEKTELESKLGASILEVDRVKILQKFNIPDDMAEFVTGTSVEDMSAKAEKIAENIKGAKISVKKFERPEHATKTDTAKIAGELFSRNSDN